MSDWASNEKDKMLFENWRSYITEADEQEAEPAEEEEKVPQMMQNLTSTDNSDSLYNVLKSFLNPDLGDEKSKTDFDNFVKVLAELIFDMADDEGIMLENISLSGDRAERRRVMDLSSEAGKKLIYVLNNMPKQNDKKATVKALNRWGRLNGVRFVMPQQQQQQQRGSAAQQQQQQQRGPEKKETILGWKEENFSDAIQAIGTMNSELGTDLANVYIAYKNIEDQQVKDRFNEFLARMLRGY